jgi:glycerol-3-phosphate acyltransferase PlsY
MTHIIFLTLLAGAYFMGSLSSAILVCKFMGLADPRTQGSKNPGTTNVLRIGGKRPAALVLLGDLAKGIIPLILAKILNISGMDLVWIGLAAILGHVFPIYYGFRGGKGFATTLGVFLGLSWGLFLAVVLTWVIIFAISRYSSLAALVSISLAPGYNLFLGEFSYVIPLIVIAAFIIWRHKENIQRLLAGTESKFEF